MSALNPVIEDISQWGNGTEILYRCPTCGNSFHIMGRLNHFCYNCGVEIEWEEMPTHLSREAARIYHNKDYQTQREIIRLMNSALKVEV